MNKKICAVMALKLNNERCPGKNTRLINDTPMFLYELNTFNSLGVTEDINVYCSSDEITKFLPKFVNFIKRPTFLDLPTSNFTQIFTEFMKSKEADVYVFLHATAPFISKETMKKCVDAVLSGKYDSAFCARKIQSFCWSNGKPYNFDASNLPRTQDLTPIFEETSGIYVFNKEVFEKYKRRVGFNPYIAEVSLKEAVDVDNEEDFELAKKIANLDL